jgi:heme-degrading monooxygenase HmoA
MLIRVWRTQIDETRVDEYETFATERSLPMFQAQDGFTGLVFARDGSACAVISFWRDREAVAALATSPSYEATVDALVATGVLVGEPRTEVFEVRGGLLKPDAILPPSRSSA